MAIGDIFSASVTKIVSGGDGLAEHQGQRVFIPFCAPGDRVRVRITGDRGGWARGEILDLEEASPLRTEPRCPLYGICGGCSFQHLSYEAQLDIKKEILTETLERAGAVFPPVTAIPSEPWEYRNRISLHAVRANRGPRAGFKSRRSGNIVPLGDCPAADPGLRAVLKNVRPPPGKDRFTLYSRGGLLLGEEGTRIGEKPVPSRGAVTLLDREISLDAAYFFQSNAAALEGLIRRLRQAAARALEDPACGKGPSGLPVMADLYAGVGTFSLFLGDLFPGGGILMEENSRALSLAGENLERSRGGRSGELRFFPQKDRDWAEKHPLNCDFAAADPPRQGLSPGMARKLCREGPPVFAYISCDPASFARDYQILAESYTPEEIFLFDFYPQTPHIETLGVFVHKRK